MKAFAAIVLLCACVPRSAAASMNETLDISLHASRTWLDVQDAPILAPFEAPGGSARIGWTLRTLRFGAGAGAYAPRDVPAREAGKTSLFSGEAYVAWVAKGYDHPRPYLELRAHTDRLRIGETSIATWGIGSRIGVLVPLSEYFFMDVGLGRDLVGPESVRATIGLGLPIPLSHL